MNWLSRTIAILIFMVGPGLAGSWLDKKLPSNLFTPLGFALGIGVSMLLLVIYAKQFTPTARGTPIPFEDEIDSDDNPSEQD